MAAKEPGGAKGKKMLGLSALAVVGVLGGLKGFVLDGGKAQAQPAAEGGGSTTSTTQAGAVVTLPPVTLNISGGRFLKLGLGLQLAGDREAGPTEGAADSDDPTKGYARAVDLAIEVFGGKSYGELVTVEGRGAAKAELVERLEAAYHGEVEGVYFTEFVMQ